MEQPWWHLELLWYFHWRDEWDPGVSLCFEIRGVWTAVLSIGIQSLSSTLPAEAVSQGGTSVSHSPSLGGDSTVLLLQIAHKDAFSILVFITQKQCLLSWH